MGRLADLERDLSVKQEREEAMRARMSSLEAELETFLAEQVAVERLPRALAAAY